jgi:hypothetical protein
MMRLAFFALALLGFLHPVTVRADHFTVKLQTWTANAPTPVAAVFPLPDGKPSSRPVLTTAAGTPVTAKWLLSNTHETAMVKDVLVHFFVVKQEKPDQAEVPKLTKDVLVESALSMDFRPQDRNEGEITFTPLAPGCYLIRLELKGAAGKNGEPFAALDLVVK